MTPLRLSALRSLRAHRTTLPIQTSRTFTRTSVPLYPRKGFEDKDSINAEATEYSKSGTDNEVAESADAFDPSKTKPEDEKESGGSGRTGTNPLEVSPGNKEVSQQGGKEAHGGSEGAAQNKKSGAGSPPKNG